MSSSHPDSAQEIDSAALPESMTSGTRLLMPIPDLVASADLWDKADWDQGEYYGHNHTAVHDRFAGFEEVKNRYLSLIEQHGPLSASAPGPGPTETRLRAMLERCTVAPLLQNDMRTQQRRLAELIWRSYGTCEDTKDKDSTHSQQGRFQVESGLLHPVYLKKHGDQLWAHAVESCRDSDQYEKIAGSTAAAAVAITTAVQRSQIPWLKDRTGQERANVQTFLKKYFDDRGAGMLESSSG